MQSIVSKFTVSAEEWDMMGLTSFGLKEAVLLSKGRELRIDTMFRQNVKGEGF